MNAGNSYIESAFDRRRVGKQSLEGFDSETGFGTFQTPSVDDFGYDANYDPTTGDLGSLPDPLTTLGNTDFPSSNPADYSVPWSAEDSSWLNSTLEYEAFGGDTSNLPSSSSTGNSGGTSFKGFFDFLGSAAGAVSKIAGVVTSTGKGSQNKVVPVSSGGNTPKRNTMTAADAGSGGGDTNTIDGGVSVHRTDSRPAIFRGTPSWTIPVLIIVATFFIVKRYWRK